MCQVLYQIRLDYIRTKFSLLAEFSEKINFLAIQPRMCSAFSVQSPLTKAKWTVQHKSHIT
jgi:hypothetical protein